MTDSAPARLRAGTEDQPIKWATKPAYLDSPTYVPSQGPWPAGHSALFWPFTRDDYYKGIKDEQVS